MLSDSALKSRTSNPVVLKLLNEGRDLVDENRPRQAIDCFQRAQDLEPEFAPAHYFEGVARMMLGQLQTGLGKLEYRFVTFPENQQLKFPVSPWRGQPIKGLRILLHHEQGIGDSIQFARFIPMVAALGPEITVRMPDNLHTLFRESFGRVAGIHSKTLGDPRYDYHCPMCSLALAFNTTLETIPNKVPYLKVPSAKSEAWQKRVRRSSVPMIGLVWAGKPSHNNDRNRSIPASALLSLAASRLADFYSLQRDIREGDADVIGRYRIRHLGCDFHDFADAAAAIQRLDLVITVDTSVAHLAGALGKPVWILLPFCADWRWMMHREESIWYPTARLFRQREPGNWISVITRVASELDTYISKFVSSQMSA